MMWRGIILIMLTLLFSGCGSMQQAINTKVQQMLAKSFGEKLTAGIDWVVDSLAKEGGFLDDPLVRIIMPPPLGLMVDVAQDLHADPKAALLETLMNRAAENAIPVAGPILKDVVMNMDTTTLTTLVDAPKSAATEYLKEKGGAVIQQSLLPAVSENLQANGAIELYGELLQVHQEANVAATAIESAAGDMAVVESVAPEQLGNYVAEQAVGGLFKKMAVKELAIRDELYSTMEAPF